MIVYDMYHTHMYIYEYVYVYVHAYMCVYILYISNSAPLVEACLIQMNMHYSSTDHRRPPGGNGLKYEG